MASGSIPNRNFVSEPAGIRNGQKKEFILRFPAQLPGNLKPHGRQAQ
jgi:hypothetical protein